MEGCHRNRLDDTLILCQKVLKFGLELRLELRLELHLRVKKLGFRYTYFRKNPDY